MKPVEIIRNFYAGWKIHPYLATYTLRSTRFTPHKDTSTGHAIPYAHITCKHLQHEQQGDRQVADYEVKIVVYCGQQVATANNIADWMSDAFDFKSLSFDNAYSLLCQPDSENPKLEPDSDGLQRDVYNVECTWLVKLVESYS